MIKLYKCSMILYNFLITLQLFFVSDKQYNYEMMTKKIVPLSSKSCKN